MLGVLALENLLDVEQVSAPAEARSCCASARPHARAARLGARGRILREQLRELGWEVRDGADGPELLPDRDDRLRTQRRARGDPRPARPSVTSGRPRTLRREPWLAASGVRVTLEPPRRSPDAPAPTGTRASAPRCPSSATSRPRTLLAHEQALIVALDQVQDPQNLGAICRSAECAGAAGVVLPERRAAEVTPAVCKASAGAVEHLPLAQVRNLTDFLTAAKARGFWCYGADGEAKLDYRQVDFSGPVVLVLGSEGTGLRPRVASACDALISLPLRGRIESLSVSAAAAVLLYAAAAARD